MTLHLVEERFYRQHEHAGVPEIASGFKHRFGLGAVGLLDETGHAVRARRQFLATLDVAIAGGGFGRRDAEGHQFSVTGSLMRPEDTIAVDIAGIDLVIRSKHLHDGVLAEAGENLEGRGSKRRSSIARNRLQQDVTEVNVDRPGLLGDDEAKVAVCDDDGRLELAGIANALQRLLKQRTI